MGNDNPTPVPSTNCVSWPVHTQDPLIGPGDEPIEVSPFKGFNVDLKQLPELQHVKLEGCVGPRLAALQNEVARLDITRAETIFNAQFPSATRYDDTHERFMFYGRHNFIPQDDWEEGWEDLPELEVVTMEIYNSMLQAIMGNGSGLSLQQGAQQPPLSRPLSRDKVRDNPPYRAPYRAIRCAITPLIAPPYRAIRCAITPLIAPPYRAIRAH